MSSLDLQKVHDDLIKVAKQAGEMIMSANPSVLQADDKKNCKRAIVLCA